MRHLWFIAVLLLAPVAALADDRLVKLSAPEPLVEAGLLKHILPRFSLKTQVKVTLVAPGETANLSLGETGRPVFDGLDETWHLDVHTPDHPGTQRFVDWLGSQVGMNAVTGFAPEGTALFSPPSARQVEVASVSYDGDATLGYDVARGQCARCHAVDEATKKTDIGSTPSFFVLRSLGDWELRFSSFYVLKPHAAFTQIADVTEPFSAARPSPIVPVELTLEELEALMAYVADLDAADLGAPLQHQ